MRPIEKLAVIKRANEQLLAFHRARALPPEAQLRLKKLQRSGTYTYPVRRSVPGIQAGALIKELSNANRTET